LIEYSQTGYVATGVQYQSQQNGDAYILRTDASGNQLWAKTFGDTLFQQALGVKEGDGGDLFVAGTTRSQVTLNNQIFVLKTDSLGDTKWLKTFAGGNYTQCNVLEKAAGGFLIGGTTTSSISSSEDACLLKIDSAGTILWNKIYQVNANTEIVEAVKELPDGSILFAGYSMPPGSSATPGFLAKTDSAGNLLWWHFYTNGRVIIHSLDVLQDGSVMMCGEGGNFQIILLKADAAGNFEWAKVYGINGPDGFFDMRAFADGNVLLSGASFIASFPNIGYDMALIKCDTAGTILWTKNFAGNYNDQCYGLIVCSDGGFAICGQTDNNSSSLVIPGIPHIVKTDNTGFSGCNETIRNYSSANIVLNDSAVAVASSSNFSSSFINFPSNNAGTDSTLCLATGIENEKYPGEKISYYPNPVEEILNVACSEPVRNSVLEIYDAFGKKVFTSPMTQQLTNSFNLSILSTGIYFLKIRNGKDDVIGKIIKL
ncbi:MAG TPA: T9SS type A sorting domain-containing protein, partial [Bacteroidia bacterium]|nr:T9SS type A sorting domain-containing protein [Bacteroidia bacterium]